MALLPAKVAIGAGERAAAIEAIAGRAVAVRLAGRRLDRPRHETTGDRIAYSFKVRHFFPLRGTICAAMPSC
jgi:hypothetical protein